MKIWNGYCCTYCVLKDRTDKLIALVSIITTLVAKPTNILLRTCALAFVQRCHGT